MTRAGSFSLPMSSVLLLFLALFASCSNDENYVETDNNQPDVIVTTMGKFLASTRSTVVEQDDTPVLQFKDEAAYTAILNKIKEMSTEEKSAYFEEIGFEGAYLILDHADEELDSIFEIEDQTKFEKELALYQSKYEGVLAFNTEDEYDVSPYLQFTDDDMALVGNIDGYVIIGDEIVSPEISTPTFDLDSDTEEAVSTETYTTPIQPGFKAFKNSSLTIKNGKYTSTMTIGRIINGNSLCVEFVTKKKQFFWKKKVKASYTSTLEIYNSSFHRKNGVACPYGCRWNILNVPVQLVGTTFDAAITNFKSSRGNTIGSATFKNIRVI